MDHKEPSRNGSKKKIEVAPSQAQRVVAVLRDQDEAVSRNRTSDSEHGTFERLVLYNSNKVDTDRSS